MTQKNKRTRSALKNLWIFLILGSFLSACGSGFETQADSPGTVETAYDVLRRDGCSGSDCKLEAYYSFRLKVENPENFEYLIGEATSKKLKLKVGGGFDIPPGCLRNLLGSIIDPTERERFKERCLERSAVGITLGGRDAKGHDDNDDFTAGQTFLWNMEPDSRDRRKVSSWTGSITLPNGDLRSFELQKRGALWKEVNPKQGLAPIILDSLGRIMIERDGKQKIVGRIYK